MLPFHPLGRGERRREGDAPVQQKALRREIAAADGAGSLCRQFSGRGAAHAAGILRLVLLEGLTDIWNDVDQPEPLRELVDGRGIEWSAGDEGHLVARNGPDICCAKKRRPRSSTTPRKPSRAQEGKSIGSSASCCGSSLPSLIGEGGGYRPRVLTQASTMNGPGCRDSRLRSRPVQPRSRRARGQLHEPHGQRRPDSPRLRRPRVGSSSEVAA